MIQEAGSGAWRSWFAVSDLAAASLAQAALSLAELGEARGLACPELHLDRRLAALWFDCSVVPQGWTLPSMWDPLAGNYRCKDGWLRLHTNAPHHRAAALSVLGAAEDQASLGRRVATWDAEALEAAVIAAGGCAAKLRSFDEWRGLPAGQALADQPLVAWHLLGQGPAREGSLSGAQPTEHQPLAGLKVLDLTRVLAGPAATRFLAGFGAEVLRIDPPQWDEPAAAVEMALGKRCALLDLTKAEDRQVFERLLSQADLLVHGYRDGALEGLGYGAKAREALSPGLVDVALNAYGWAGPWQQRRGFDTIVQQSSGLADYGRQGAAEAPPVMLPVQALDHATGYLAAAAACQVLAERARSGRRFAARLSLARTADLLATTRRMTCQGEMLTAEAADYADPPEQTAWGSLRRLRFPLRLGASGPRWPHPAGPYKSSPPAWD
jgi:crotonobetainyl-CoA:carnitine CoA-transferase CaiB-like acyl-CoA transferase